LPGFSKRKRKENRWTYELPFREKWKNVPGTLLGTKEQAMLPSKYFLNLVFILTLVLSALSSTTTSVSAENDNNALKANPRLLPMAEEGPDAILKVIVQKDVQNKELKNIEVEDEILKGGRAGQPTGFRAEYPASIPAIPGVARACAAAPDAGIEKTSHSSLITFCNLTVRQSTQDYVYKFS
jgi:hypothetical protein